jgi:hypothetical protein
MKVLIMVAENPQYSLLVTLHTKKLQKEVLSLLAQRRNSMAMATALSKGRFEREVAHNEVHAVNANLLLSTGCASWDLKN